MLDERRLSSEKDVCGIVVLEITSEVIRSLKNGGGISMTPGLSDLSFSG